MLLGDAVAFLAVHGSVVRDRQDNADPRRVSLYVVPAGTRTTATDVVESRIEVDFYPPGSAAPRTGLAQCTSALGESLAGRTVTDCATAPGCYTESGAVVRDQGID